MVVIGNEQWWMILVNQAYGEAKLTYNVQRLCINISKYAKYTK